MYLSNTYPPQIILEKYSIFIFRYFILPTTLFYGKIQENHFYESYAHHIILWDFSEFSFLCIFYTPPPLLLLWKNGKEFLLVDLKILKNGFFWKIFFWVWRFMGSCLELFLFLVFVIEGFIVFRSFFDN